MFVFPDDKWYMYVTYDFGDPDEPMEFSESCNPNFVDRDGFDCSDFARGGRKDCAGSYGRAEYLVAWAVVNEHGIMETGLQCPQCGCDADADVARNLYDVYAENP